MNNTDVMEILAPVLTGLSTYRVNGELHWLGCDVIQKLGLSSTTQAIKGTREKPKLKFPAYRMHMIPEVNAERSVYLLNITGVIEVIKLNSNKKTKILKERLSRCIPGFLQIDSIKKQEIPACFL